MVSQCVWWCTSFLGVNSGGGVTLAGHTQRSQANPTARDPRLALTVRYAPLTTRTSC